MESDKFQQPDAHVVITSCYEDDSDVVLQSILAGDLNRVPAVGSRTVNVFISSTFSGQFTPLFGLWIWCHRVVKCAATWCMFELYFRRVWLQINNRDSFVWTSDICDLFGCQKIKKAKWYTFPDSWAFIISIVMKLRQKLTTRLCN
jgi:hypothetical protein